MKKSYLSIFILLLFEIISIKYVLFITLPKLINLGVFSSYNELDKFLFPKHYLLLIFLLNIMGVIGGIFFFYLKKIGLYFMFIEIFLQLFIQSIYKYLDTDILFCLFLLFLNGFYFIPKWKKYN